jgi:16S rRNA (cytosine1402-N4)-methyltransferase
MFDEMLSAMQPKDGEIYIDGTFGAGGYTRGLLEAADCKVIAIDRDENVKKIANELKKDFPGRIELLIGQFSQMKELLAREGIPNVNGIVLDIGVSSMQIDTPERGFSFMHDGPLDMRMGSGGMSAADVVNDTEENQLANIIYRYGGERHSRAVAKAIVAARQETPITTTSQLAKIIRSVVWASKDKIDPATRTFQALRIWVNDELGELERALDAAEEILLPEGRLVIVTFHSLEDSMVKSFINEKSGKTKGVSRHVMNFEPEIEVSKSFKPITRKAVKPTDAEIDRNIRSRSAKLRAAVRV